MEKKYNSEEMRKERREVTEQWRRQIEEYNKSLEKEKEENK